MTSTFTHVPRSATGLPVSGGALQLRTNTYRPAVGRLLRVAGGAAGAADGLRSSLGRCQELILRAGCECFYI